MKKYMIVYDGGDYNTAYFVDKEEEVDTLAEVMLEDGVKYEVYIYTIYGYQLLYR